MIINIKDLKKKIIYRSTYRGSKEMDKLLSSFCKKYINEFDSTELTHLCDLLDIDDENLYNFNQGKKITVKFKINKVTEIFKNFVYKES